MHLRKTLKYPCGIWRKALSRKVAVQRHQDCCAWDRLSRLRWHLQDKLWYDGMWADIYSCSEKGHPTKARHCARAAMSKSELWVILVTIAWLKFKEFQRDRKKKAPTSVFMFLPSFLLKHCEPRKTTVSLCILPITSLNLTLLWDNRC